MPRYGAMFGGCNMPCYDKQRFRRWLLAPVIEQLKEMECKFTMSLADVTQEVQEATTVMESAKALIEGLAAEIRANIGNAAALKTLANQLDAKSNELQAAVVANTPAPPEPAPEA